MNIFHIVDRIKQTLTAFTVRSFYSEAVRAGFNNFKNFLGSYNLDKIKKINELKKKDFFPSKDQFTRLLSFLILSQIFYLINNI